MRFHKVIVPDVKSNRRLEIVQLPAECEREARKALAVRANGQIRPFDVACANF